MSHILLSKNTAQPSTESWPNRRLALTVLKGVAVVLIANQVQVNIDGYVHAGDNPDTISSSNPLTWVAAPISEALIDTGLYHQDPTAAKIYETDSDRTVQIYGGLMQDSDRDKIG